MMKTFVGIDPGSKGFICVIKDTKTDFFSIEDNTWSDISDFLKRVNDEATEGIICVLEEIHAILGSSAKATFSFGETNGLLKGILIANNIPFTIVQPKKWQMEIWDNIDKVYSYKKERKVVDTKATSINAAIRLFPNIDLRKNERCRKVDDNKCDSLLMAEYARRKNL